MVKWTCLEVNLVVLIIIRHAQVGMKKVKVSKVTLQFSVKIQGQVKVKLIFKL